MSRWVGHSFGMERSLELASLFQKTLAGVFFAAFLCTKKLKTLGQHFNDCKMVSKIPLFYSIMTQNSPAIRSWVIRFSSHLVDVAVMAVPIGER